ncbi:ATP-binding protein [Streptomyces sp. NPDC087440]|uniref:ATP-binding protein n=1 Tax=Streptomyces sp. NPDC087440 TaxID=3365790 RepID=UPI0037FDDF16
MTSVLEADPDTESDIDRFELVLGERLEVADFSYRMDTERTAPDDDAPGGGLSMRACSYPGRARRACVAVMNRRHLDAYADRMGLLVSELVTNAVQHALEDEIRVCLEIGTEALVLMVRSGSAGEARRRLPSDTEESGRGLWLVEEMADRYGTSDDGAWACCAVYLPHEEAS